MTREEKILVVKDLCGRLLYVTYVRIIDPTCLDKQESVTEGCVGGYSDTRMCQDFSMDEIFEFIESGNTVKPYLRSLSNMTEEEKSYFHNFKYWILKGDVEHCTINMVDWLNAHHFDYRGMIEKGLALEALEKMYK